VVRGVDVSSLTGTVDWAQVKAAGYAFGIARLGDGATFMDPQFDQNWAAMKTNGLIRGAFQTFEPSQDPAEQAAQVSKMLPNLPSTWSGWRFWMTSAQGTVPGISGSVDIDEFNGGLAPLRAFSSPPAAPALPPPAAVALALSLLLAGLVLGLRGRVMSA
jgi:GH25 family lysozyme M1 (1,4-beta-N-acetylmuramidase)